MILLTNKRCVFMSIEILSNRAPEVDADRLTPRVLVAESNHRIANNLALIAGMLRLQASDVAKKGEPLSPEVACTMLEEVGYRIETVTRLHRLLAESGGEADIDLGVYLREVAEAAVGSMSQTATTRLTYASTAHCRIGMHQALPLGFVVGELATNAMKYAHPSGVPRPHPAELRAPARRRRSYRGRRRRRWSARRLRSRPRRGPWHAHAARARPPTLGQADV